MQCQNRIRLGLGGLVIVLSATAGAGQQKVAGPVTVHEDGAGNGWDVRVSFGAAPNSFGRAGHAWTLERARELAEEWQRKNAHLGDGLGVAAVRLDGKDGDGEVRPGQGPRLPDWPIVEQQFRARVAVKSDAPGLPLAEIGAAYRQAARATEALLREAKPQPTALQQKQIEGLYQDYNRRVDALAKSAFQGQPPPLPRLTPLTPEQWGPYAADWADARRTQHTAEHLSRQVRAAKSDLDDWANQVLGQKKQAIQAAQTAGTNTPRSRIAQDILGLARTLANKQQDIAQQQKAADQVQKAVDQQQSALTSKLVDSSAVLPAATGYASGTNGAVYVPSPRVLVYKSDDKGEPLPDDQQPAGYPRPDTGARKLMPDETRVVDPRLRVMALDADPGNVLANLSGKVVAVDKDAGSVTIQVDEKGTTLEYSGVDPGIKEGEFVTPITPIGRWQAPTARKVREISIRAYSPSDQIVDPEGVVNFARLPTVGPKDLRRPVSAPDALPLPVKQNMAPPPGGGKGTPKETLSYDETIPKELAKGTRAKKAAAAGQATLLKAQLQRLKAAEAAKNDEIGLLKAKLKAVNQELKKADARLRAFDAKYKSQADRLDNQNKLDAELAALRREKSRLDEQAAAVDGSSDKAAIAAYRQDAKAHDQRVNDYLSRAKVAAALDKALGPVPANLGSQRANLQKADNDLKAERDQLQASLDKASRALSGLHDRAQDLSAKLQAVTAGNVTNPP